MESGMQDQQIPRLHLDALLDHLRRVDGQVIHLVAQVHDHPGTTEPLHGNLVDGAARGDEMPRRIEVGSHVIRGLDVLRVDPVLRLALDVLDLERRIVGPEGDLLVERLREIVGSHGNSVRRDQTRARSTARDSARRVSTRASWRRYAAEACRSAGGSISSSPASSAAARIAAGSGCRSCNAAAARCARTGPSPTLSSAIRASRQHPALSRVTTAATPTSAKSPWRLANSSNATPVPGASGRSSMAVT